MGLLLVAGLVAVVTTAALTEGLHNFLRLQPELEGGGETGKGEGGFGVLKAGREGARKREKHCEG